MGASWRRRHQATATAHTHEPQHQHFAVQPPTMEPYTAPSTRIELKKLSQKFRDCIQMLNVKMEELSKSASRDCGDDIISSSTAGNSPGLQDALIQLQRLCEISEECM